MVSAENEAELIKGERKMAAEVSMKLASTGKLSPRQQQFKLRGAALS